MPLSIGARLGSYEIVGALGAGGMGEVYRAHDTKLGRDVAIKILPDAVVHDPERVARFEREAKLLAALNHPHIAAIHGLEEANPSTGSGQAAVRFLVLELDESAGVNHSHRSPNGNRQMRRLLNQAANAAVKTKGSIFELVYRRLVVRLGHAQAIGAIAHRLCRLVWKILHDGVAYDERGPEVTRARLQRRSAKMIRELRSLDYRVERTPSPARILA